MRFIDRIKSAFSKQADEPEKIVVRFCLPDGKEFGVEALKLDYNKQIRCKVHWDYQGVAVPINDCPICKHIYEQKSLR